MLTKKVPCESSKSQKHRTGFNWWILVAMAVTMGAGIRAATAAENDAAADSAKGFEKMLRIQYDAIREASADKFSSVYAPEAFVLGPIADEVVTGQDGVKKVVAGLLLEPGSSKEATTVDSEDVAEGFRVGLSSDNACAWTYDQIAVTTPAGFGYFRIATLASKESGKWQVVAQSWSCPVSEADEAFASGQFIKPLPMPGEIGPGAQALAQSVTDYVEHARWDDWNGRTDTFFVGPGLNHAIVVGDQKSNASAHSSLKRWTIKPGTGGTFAKLVCGGNAGFATYNVTFVDKENDHAVYPMRAIEFYSKDADRYRRVLIETGATIRKLNRQALPVL